MDVQAKKTIADAIFKKLNPHFSALLGTNQGFGFQTSGGNFTQDMSIALKEWFEHDDSAKLEALLRTAQLTNALSEQELDSFLDQIEATK